MTPFRWSYKIPGSLKGPFEKTWSLIKPIFSDEAVEAATRAVGVHHFIRTLPNGYDTVLDDSVTLSVGQKQLLTIARTLLKDAPSSSWMKQPHLSIPVQKS